MNWLKLTLACPSASVENIAGLLQRFGATSISLSAASAEPLLVEAGDAPEGQWEDTRLSALLDADTDLDILLACLRNCVAAGSIMAGPHIECVADRDWVGAAQELHRPLIFADRLCICPGWHEPPPGVPQVVRLDPGLAFGTGKHETTAMCLEWLARQDLAGKRVIDYGCGSGVLALAAARLGARAVLAVDIDPQALQVARDNTVHNHLQDIITVIQPDQMTAPAAEVLLANILLHPLLALAPVFTEMVTRGGHLLLSGLLAPQAEECLAAYQTWFNMEAPVYRNEWALLHGVRS